MARTQPRRDRNGRFSARGSFKVSRGKLVRRGPIRRIVPRPTKAKVNRRIRRDFGEEGTSKVIRQTEGFKWLATDEAPDFGFLAVPRGEDFPFDLRRYWLRCFYLYVPYAETTIAWTRLFSAVDVMGHFGRRWVRTGRDFNDLVTMIRETFIDETVGDPPYAAQLLRKSDLR